MVIIGTPSKRLVFESDGNPDYLRAALVAPGLRAQIEVYVYYAVKELGDLTAFFDSMEAAWRGWAGDKTWASLEGELSLSARHVGSAIAIVVDMRSTFDSAGGDWSVRAELRVDAGAQLSAIARDLRVLVVAP